jgi:hypothetical protein
MEAPTTTIFRPANAGIGAIFIPSDQVVLLVPRKTAGLPELTMYIGSARRRRVRCAATRRRKRVAGGEGARRPERSEDEREGLPTGQDPPTHRLI